MVALWLKTAPLLSYPHKIEDSISNTNYEKQVKLDLVRITLHFLLI